MVFKPIEMKFKGNQFFNYMNFNLRRIKIKPLIAASEKSLIAIKYFIKAIQLTLDDINHQITIVI